MTGLRVPRAFALWTIAALVAASSGVSFAESYRGLYLWAHHHLLAGAWAAIWPLQIDTFIAVGELTLFVALADQWQARSRAAAWTVTGIGLAVSVMGNVGHVASSSWTARGTAAIPPLAAAASLAVGLGVLKRVVASAPGTHLIPRAREEGTAVPVGEVAVGVADTSELVAGSNGHSVPEYGREAARLFADKLAAGTVPGVRTIREALHIGQPKATAIRDYLQVLARVPADR